MGGRQLPGEAELLQAIPALHAADPTGPTKMPLEARMYGIFAGFLMTWLLAGWMKRGHAVVAPPPWLLVLMIAFIALMGFDGLNATLYDVNSLGVMIPYLYAPRLDLRLATGLLSGIGMGGILLPVVNYALWREHASRPIFDNVFDLATLLVWAGIIYALVVSGSGLFFYPVSLLGVLGVISLVGALNIVMLLSFFPHHNAARNWREALNPIAAAIFLSGLELGLLSLLRYLVLGNTVLP